MGMKIGLIIDSDWFFGKMEEFDINWKDPNIWKKLLSPQSWGSSNTGIDFVCPILINTLAKDTVNRTKGKKFETVAKKVGFDILHRLEKQGESSHRTGYKGGSLALLGASVEALASQVDLLVVHATGLETLEILRFVMAEHQHIRTVLFSNENDVSEDIRERIQLIPIDNGRLRDFFESNNGANVSTVKTVRLNELFPSEVPHKAHGLGKVVDVGGVFAMEQMVGCTGGSMFKAKPLKNVREPSKMAYSIVTISKSSTLQRDLQIKHWEKAGWEVVRTSADGGKQLDDGLVGACMSRCSSNCSEVMLFGPDIDFLSVEKLLSEIHGTHMIRVAPDYIKERKNVTSHKVVKSKFNEFIPLRIFLAENDRIVNVESRRLPSKPHNRDARRIWRENCRKKEDERRDKYVSKLNKRASD
jgi:hypothetical protein